MCVTFIFKVTLFVGGIGFATLGTLRNTFLPPRVHVRLPCIVRVFFWGRLHEFCCFCLVVLLYCRLLYCSAGEETIFHWENGQSDIQHEGNSNVWR